VFRAFLKMSIQKDERVENEGESEDEQLDDIDADEAASAKEKIDVKKKKKKKKEPEESNEPKWEGSYTGDLKDGIRHGKGQVLNQSHCC
jgi:hypothetical protein